MRHMKKTASRSAIKFAAALAAGFMASSAAAGLLDNAWLMGVTDKDPLSYKPGEEIVFTVTPRDLCGEIPAGEYFMEWKMSDDYGRSENGKAPLAGEPFIYRTSLDKAGFVRLEVYVVDKSGARYAKKFTGDASTPEGRKAMNAFERSKKAVFFDGGAGVDVDSLASHEEPGDFDEFWARQYKRLDLVPVKEERVEIKCPNPKARLYAVRIDCAGLRPVTGYLSVPKAVDDGGTFPCRLETHGYSGNGCTHGAPSWTRDSEIVLNINAHGLKLAEFGATEADTKALRWEVRSNGCSYAFDAKQNEDPEVAYFNGMVLRVKRALQYLKTLKGWNGKDLVASGGSQGGLQTIWAAGCGEGVTLAESGITWCCDMFSNNLRRDHKISSDGWYIPWTESMGYYDAANFAKRIPRTCRTVVTRAGLGDYCCPPMGLAKMWNNIPGNTQINWVQGSEHGYVPPAYEGRDFTRSRE
jgi:cephalosporin-C deacetylase-like acetyl esterase